MKDEESSLIGGVLDDGITKSLFYDTFTITYFAFIDGVLLIFEILSYFVGGSFSLGYIFYVSMLTLSY